MTDVRRIELAGWSESGDGARPVNAYLLPGEQPALVGTGTRATARELTDALREHGVDPSAVHRILSPSWALESLGAASWFVRSDLFVPSEDGVQPRALHDFHARREAALRQFAEEHLADRVDSEVVTTWFARKFANVTNRLDFIPIRDGQKVYAGGRYLEVLAAPGPHPEHVMLWSPSDRALFCGDFTMFGIPTELDSVPHYIDSLTRAAELEPRWLFPTRGEPSPRAMWSLKRMIGMAESYLDGITQQLTAPKTVRETVVADFGREPDDPIELLEAMRDRQVFLEALESIRQVRAEGAGAERRYVATHQ